MAEIVVRGKDLEAGMVPEMTMSPSWASSQLNFQNETVGQTFTIAALQRRHEDNEKLKKLTAEELHRATEHTSLLNTEIDALRQMNSAACEEIHRLRCQLTEERAKSESLATELAETRVERAVFAELEAEKRHLLDALEQTREAAATAVVEKQYYESLLVDVQYAQEERTATNLSADVLLPIENQKLRVETATLRDVINNLRERLQVTEAALKTEQSARAAEWAVRSEQLTRSQAREYRVMVDRDEQERQNMVARTELAAMETQLKIQSTQNQALQYQLHQEYETQKQLEVVVGETIAHAESQLATANAEMVVLKQKNSALAAERQLLREIVTRASARGQFYVLGNDKPYQPHGVTTISNAPGDQLPTVGKMDSLTRINPRVKFQQNDHISTPSTQSVTLQNRSRTQNAQHTRNLQMQELTPGSLLYGPTAATAEAGIFPIIDMVNAQSGIQFADLHDHVFARLLFTIQLLAAIGTSLENHTGGSGLGSLNTEEQIILLESKRLALDNFQLKDDHMNQLVSRLRLLPTKFLHTVDVRQNQLTFSGLHRLLVWLVSWSEDELAARKEPLLVDARENRIQLPALIEIRRFFRVMPEVTWVDFMSPSDDTIVVYGRPIANSASDQQKGSNFPESSSTLSSTADIFDTPSIIEDSPERADTQVLFRIDVNSQHGYASARTTQMGVVDLNDPLGDLVIPSHASLSSF